MTKKTSIAMLGGVIALGVLGWLRPAVGQDTSRRPLNPVEPDIQLPVEHPECVFFGPQHDSFVRAVQNGGSMRGGSVLGAYRLGVLTDVVSRALAHPTCVGSPASASASTTANPCPVGTTNNTTFTNTIDQYIFQALTAANVTPAPMTTDYEFVR